MYRSAAIVGIGQTDFSRQSGRTEWQLAIEAVRAALADAGVAAGDVDGMVRYSYDNVDQAMMVRALGVRDLRWFSDVPYGGTAQCAVLAQAAAAIHAGIARIVVIWRALNERSGHRYGRAEQSLLQQGKDAGASGLATPWGQFSAPFGLVAPGQVMSLWAQRYAHAAGLDQETFARTLGTIAVEQRRYAMHNPLAMMSDRPLDMQGYLAARMISTPLRLYDYCLETDGAVALVMTDAATAGALRHDPVYLLAAHQGLSPHSEPMAAYTGNLLSHAAEGNVRKLYDDAGVGPEHMHFAQLYDATSFQVLSDLETYGFAPAGRGWSAVLEHGIGPASPLPVNTHGGHLSEGYVHGLNHVTEAVRQLRGTACNQVADAELGLVGCNGTSAAILGR